MTEPTTGLQYIFKKSTNDNTFSPVIYLIHGYGSNEEDLFSFAEYLPKEATIISVRAPLKLSFGGYVWYSIHNKPSGGGVHSDDEEAKKSCASLIKFIENTAKEHKLDDSRVTIMGFSQGAVLGFSLVVSYSQKIKNLIALSGYYNPNIDIVLDQPKYANTNIYCSHGTEDEVIPFWYANEQLEIFKRLPFEVQHKTYTMGHSISEENFTSVLNWLTKRL